MKMYFKKPVDPQLWCDSVLLIDFQMLPFHIAMQFETLLINFRKHDQWSLANFAEDQKKYEMKKLLDISDSRQQSSRKSLRKLTQTQDIGLWTAHNAVSQKLT